ncbi:hypothetical protein [Vibrio neptunius]|uniref:hypothetical protein n=1 Tax=Vibrio neptunius TaxID=170651 RepID=UPI003CE54ADE
MTDNYAALGDIVTQSRQLLDLIKGGALAKFDQDAKAALASQASAVANAVNDIQGKIPRIPLTLNQEMKVSSGTLPDKFTVRNGVSFEHLATIDRDPSRRGALAMALITDIETDLKKIFSDFSIASQGHYVKSFNIFRVRWDIGNVADKWLFFPASCNGYIVPGQGIQSSCALIKLESGELQQTRLGKGVIANQWVLTKQLQQFNGFGSYVHPVVVAASVTGSLLLALPVVSTGDIAHPNQLFSLCEVK